MAFGTIAIWTESGDYQEFEIEKQTTSIGRLPGNDIVLNTNAVSRYHAQIEVADGQVFLLDKETVNGTFINDQIITPETRYPLSKDSRIVMGDVRMVFIPPEATTRTQILLTPEALKISEDETPFSLVLDKPYQKVAPGARLNLSLLIQNIGVDEQSYLIKTSGMEEEWVRLNWQELTLGPDQEAEVQVSIRPPRSSTTNPGLYPLTVTVQLADQPEVKLQGERAIEVAGYSGFAMDAREGKNGNYRVSVQNQGNIPLNISLNGFSRGNQLAYVFKPSNVLLEAGEAKTVDLEVKLRRGVPKPEGPMRFAVLAQSHDAAGYTAPLSMQYVHNKPSLVPLWVGAPLVLMIAGLVAVVLAVGVAFFVLGGRGANGDLLAGAVDADEAVETNVPVKPTSEVVVTPTLAANAPDSAGAPEAEILRFDADPPSIIYRTEQDVLLQWDVINHTSLRLLGPDEQEISLTDQQISTRQIVIQTEDLLPGPAFYFLEAVGEDNQTVTETVEVTIATADCSVQGDENIVLYDSPNILIADEIGELRPETTVVITGRTNDINWLRVSVDNGPLGWVGADNISCEPGSVPFAEYIVITQESN